MAEYKVGRRYHFNSDDVIEITGQRKDGTLVYSYVNPKTGYLQKGFGGTLAQIPQKRSKNKQIVVNDNSDMTDDPNDDITSVNEYNEAVETFGEKITPFEEDAAPINQSLATSGNVVKALGKVAIVAGTVGMMTAGFMLGPWIAFGIAMAGMGSFLGLDFIGDRMRKKAGVIQKKIYMV